MGYTPRETTDRGSMSREANQSRRDEREANDRSQRNRDRREAEARAKAEQEKKAQAEAARAAAERKAREEAERKAKQEAERKAREEAERKAKIAQRKAESEAEKEALTSSGGFSPMGGLSSYGLNASSISPIGGRGVLAGMRSASDPEEREIYERSQNPSQYGSIHFREPKAEETKAGTYNKENAYSGEAINENTSDENIARLTGDAIEEKQMEIARDFISAPLGPAGQVASKAIGWASSLFDGDTDYEQKLKEQAKSVMDGGSTIQNIGGAAQAGAALGSMKGIGLVKDIAPTILNPAAGAILNVADDVVGLNSYLSNNKKYLEENGLLPDSQHQNNNRDRDNRERSGVLSGMLPQPSPTPVAPVDTEESTLPDFTWYEGDEFNTNYGMRFKR